VDKATDLKLLRQSIIHCEKCSLHEGVTPVPFSGSHTPLVTVVGTGPGKTELATGQAWSGKTGIYTKKLLREAGIDLHGCAWMNVVCCGDEPKQVHIDACRLHARRQLATLDAPYTLVLGGVALGAMLPFRTTLGALRGLWWRPSHGGWAMATYHPASLVHGYAPNQEAVVKRDLERFAGSVLMRDLKPPKVSEYCIKCNKWAGFFIQGIPFCREHNPKRLKKIEYDEQMTLLEEL
jgi:DNA polymerase